MRHYSTLPKVIPGLTGLRGVAAVWVVVFHIFQGSTTPLLRSGWMGVDVFFMLSGLILSHVYADDFLKNGLKRYKSFLLARVARIFPLHLFALVILVAVVMAFPTFATRYPSATERFSPTCLIASAILIQNWFHWPPGCWNSPSWSLSAEWLAYLVFPAFVFTTQRWRRPVVAIGLAMTSLTLFGIMLLLKGVDSASVQGAPGLLRMGFEIAAGCLIHRALVTGLKPLPATADFAALCMAAAAFVFHEVEFVGLFAIGLILILAAQNRGPIARALSLPPVILLGEISYSIYLIHWIIIQLYNFAFEKIVLDSVEIAFARASLLATTLLLAYPSYHFVELPARAWGRTLGIKKSEAQMNADAI